MSLKKTFTKKIGKTSHRFQVEGDDLYEVLMEERKLSFPDVHNCGKCGSDSIFLFAHNPKNKFKYVTIKCPKCKAYLNLGQQQENPDIFYLRSQKDQNGNTLKDDGGRPIFDWQTFDPNE